MCKATKQLVPLEIDTPTIECTYQVDIQVNRAYHCCEHSVDDWNNKRQEEEHSQQVEKHATTLGGKVGLTLSTGVGRQEKLNITVLATVLVSGESPVQE